MARTQWAVLCGPAFVAAFAMGLFLSGQGPLDGSVLASSCGPVLMWVAAGLMVPWIGLIATQLGRIPGCGRELILCQAALGGCATIVLVLVVSLWQVSAQVPEAGSFEHDFHEAAKRLLIAPAFPLLAQGCVIGIAILRDHSMRPLFPRWGGYANLGMALLVVPCGAFLALSTDAAHQMEGLLIGVPVAMFAAWFILMSILLGGASRKRDLAAT